MNEPVFREQRPAHPPGLVDIHCHILPGVDDGAPDMKTAMTMLRWEYEDGVRAIILTPHFRLHMFENEEAEIRAAYERLSKAAEKHFPDLELYLGCELHAHSDMVAAIKGREQFRLTGSSYVLVEFSPSDSAKYIRNNLYRLRSNGFEPIAAHVERYRSVAGDLDFAGSLVDMGVKLQVNADSVLGRSGLRARRFCRELMEHDMLHFIGSDAHDLRARPPRLGECAEWLEKRMGTAYAETVMIDNPREIIDAGV